MKFIDQLKLCWEKNNSLLCVGLDPLQEKLPKHLSEQEDSYFQFCREIVDATSDLVCAYKPQIAYFAAAGKELELEKLISYIHDLNPEIPVILDAKRGDIGETSKMYAQEAFVRYQADAVTVNPYLGTDGLKPFLDWQDKGVVILCRTSNASAGELQDLSIEGSKVYLQVAELASRKWNYNGNVMLVVGATYPQELKEIRAAVGDIPFLVPGVGAQGGDTQEAVRSGIRSDGTGLAINASRAIIYAGSGQDFNEKAREAAQNLQKEINAARATIMAKGN